MYLCILTLLGLCCCTWAFSSFVQGLLFIAMCSLLIAMASLTQSTDSRLVGSVVEVRGLSSSGLRALEHWLSSCGPWA